MPDDNRDKDYQESPHKEEQSSPYIDPNVLIPDNAIKTTDTPCVGDGAY